MTVNVCTLAILRQFRVPDGMVLHYPNVNSNPTYFTPSSLLFLDDDLLGIFTINYISKAFLRKGGDPTANCLVSPIYTPRELLAKFPPTKIYVSEIDGLRDMSL